MSRHPMSPVGQLACGGVRVNSVAHDPEAGLTVKAGLLSADAVTLETRLPARAAIAAATIAADARNRFLALLILWIPPGGVCGRVPDWTDRVR